MATANTMLLLSRLYSYSSEKFFRFLKSEYFSDSFNPEIVFTLQEKGVDSIPDAKITQESFKIVVETKMSDWFYEDQLLRHLNSFSDEKYKVMITLAPELMEEIVRVHFPDVEENLLKNAMEVFYNIRTIRDIRKKPSTSELIDWVNALQIGGIPTEKIKSALPFIGVVVKKDEDLQIVKNTPNY